MTEQSDGERNGEALIRVYVWELPVRLTHWTIVLTVLVLSFTGLYLHAPFFRPAPTGDSFLFAKMRFTHVVAGFVFTLAALVRIYWAFAGNRHAHWRALLPLRRAQLGNLADAIRYYALLRRRPPEDAEFRGHNQLAALAYMGLYLLFIVQIISGFALFAWLLGTEPWITLFGWAYRLLQIQWVRLIHYFLTFIFFAFTIHHVYSSILVDVDGKAGILSSIFTGFKYVKREEREQSPAAPAPSNVGGGA